MYFTSGLECEDHNQVAMWPEADQRDFSESLPYPYLGQINEQDLEAELQGEILKVILKKTTSRFGLMIIGGDQPGELLQIMSIVPGSVADRDGRLQVGDVLVRINSISILRYSNRMMVELLQSLPLYSDVEIEIRRGYPLPELHRLPQHEKASVSVVKGSFGSSLGEQRCEINLLFQVMLLSDS